MNSKARFLAIMALFALSVNAYGKPLQTFDLPVTQSPSFIYSLSVRVGVQEPDSTPIGDILYFTGFGDRLDNHGPLFDEWVASGFRVISFDYPSHGETSGTPLDFFTFGRLAELATQVEKATRQDNTRPLIVSGWSTGGLLAVRMVQGSSLPHFDRPVAGLILFAPGISVDTIVGTPTWHYWFGEITDATLTHNPDPPHKGEPQPKSPISLSSFVFAGFLKINSWLSQYEKFPNLPTLIFVAGDKGDVYADSQNLKDWIAMQDSKNGANITMVDEPGARHEIDNETAQYGGPQSRQMAAEFAKSIVSGNGSLLQPRN